MAFEAGNRYGRMGAIVTDALRRAVMSDDQKLLRRAVQRCLTQAANGSLPHLTWIADRLDGRVLPQLPDAGDGTLVVSWVMQGTSTSERSLSSEVIDHSPAGSHPANAVREGPHAAIETDGGVHVGVTVLPHTLQVPVPVPSRSESEQSSAGE
jgi:hypothetical protein